MTAQAAESDRLWRRRRRESIRLHHPDAGADPGVLQAALAALAAERVPRVYVVHRERGPLGVWHRWRERRHTPSRVR